MSDSTGGGGDEGGGRVFQFIRGDGPPGVSGNADVTDAEAAEFRVMAEWVSDPWKLASLRLGIVVQDIYVDLGREYTIGTLAAQLAKTIDVWAESPQHKKHLTELVIRIIRDKLGGNSAT